MIRYPPNELMLTRRAGSGTAAFSLRAENSPHCFLRTIFIERKPVFDPPSILAEQKAVIFSR